MMRSARACLLCLLLPGSSMASEFTDFRIPPSSRSSYSLSLHGSANRYSRVKTGLSERQGAVDGDLFATYHRAGDSDPSQWLVGIQAATSGRRSHDHSDSYFETPGPGGPLATNAQEIDQTVRQVQEYAAIFASARRYPFATPIGFEAAGQFLWSADQRWFGLEDIAISSLGGPVLRTEAHRSESSWSYWESGFAELGAGYGRVRDASAVFAVILLLERLERDRVLVKPPGAETRRRLIELFSLRASFQVPHQHPEKFFWQEVERLLREDGAFGEVGFDAFALLHATEFLELGSFARRAGWYVGPLVTAQYSHQIERDDVAHDFRALTDGVPTTENISRFSTRRVQSLEGVLYGGRIEVALPLGSRTQLDLVERAQAGGDKDAPERMAASGLLRLRHLIAERWLLSGFASHTRSLRGGVSPTSVWRAESGAGVAYYLEDALRLSLDVSQVHWSAHRLDVATSRERSNNLRVVLGVQFERGRLDAPGLLQPMRGLN